MRVLSVPLPTSGTVDLVRGHPALTGGRPYSDKYAGHQHVRLCDVEMQGQEDGLLTASWFAQV